MGSSGQGAMEKPSITASQTMAWGSFLAPCTRCSAKGRTARGGKRLVPQLPRFLSQHISRYFSQGVRLAREGGETLSRRDQQRAQMVNLAIGTIARRNNILRAFPFRPVAASP